MKLDISFKDLEVLVRSIKAEKVSWDSGVKYLASAELLEDLDIGKKITLDSVNTDESSLLRVEEEVVILYIKDAKLNDETKEISVESMPRFHFANCSTVSMMRNKNKLDRFIATNNISGKFSVTLNNVNTHELELRPCANCLVKLNYQNYNYLPMKMQQEILDNFSLIHFFSTHGRRIRIKR